MRKELQEEKRKSLPERYILPLVILARVLTSWYSATIWGFVAAYILGNSIAVSAILALFTATLAWLIWKDDTIEEMIGGEKEDGED